MASLLSAPLPGNAYVNSEAYAEIELYSLRRTTFYLTSISTPSRSMREALVMYTKGPSVVRRFVSSAYECILSKIQQNLRKSVFDAVATSFHLD